MTSAEKPTEHPQWLEERKQWPILPRLPAAPLSSLQVPPFFKDATLTMRLERHGTYPKRSEEHTSELQSLMRISYAVFCLKKKTKYSTARPTTNTQRP